MVNPQRALVVTAALATMAVLFVQGNAAATSFISSGDGGWESVVPRPVAQQWRDVHFVNDKTGWVIGATGAIMKTTDGGKNWAPQGPRINKFLTDVCFTDVDHGWVVGSGDINADATGIILKTCDSGATWRVVLEGKMDGLRSVCFVNNEVGWAVGGRPSHEGVILKTTDGGENWLKQDCGAAVKEGATRVFESVSFVDEQNGWVVDFRGNVYRTADGGKTWVYTSAGKTCLTQVQFVDARTGWILSGSTILKTTDSGANWVPHGLSDVKFSQRFHFSDALNGIVLTDKGILRTRDGGDTWVPTSMPKVPLSIGAVHMVDAANGWIVGEPSTFLRTSDGGSTWQVQSSTGGESWMSGQFFDSSTGCVVGYARTATGVSGLVIRTEDAGQTWSRQSLPDAPLGTLFFTDKDHGWAAGAFGTMVATIDGGKTWKPQNSGTKKHIAGLHFVNKGVGWAVGDDGTCLKTTDGGVTWTELSLGTTDHMIGIFFLDEDNGWVCGANGRMMSTTDGGKTWKRQPSGTTAGLGGLYFVNKDIGWASDSEGKIINTTDGGATWVRQRETRNLEQLPAVWFLDEKTGWTAGSDSPVHTGILHTADGGKTWTAQNAGHGALQDIQFTDKDHGWAIGWWFVLRTTTGGLPGAVWAKKQPDGKRADFGHLVITKKSQGYLLAEHPDSRVGIHIKTSDSKPAVGDYIYVHGKVTTENNEKIIAADSIDIMCAGWGILPPK